MWKFCPPGTFSVEHDNKLYCKRCRSDDAQKKKAKKKQNKQEKAKAEESPKEQPKKGNKGKK